MTSPHHPFRLADLRRVGAVALVGLLTACGADSTSAPTPDDVAKAVAAFTQMSDSIVKSGGDTGIASAYASLGDALRKGRRVSPVTITVDGVATPFMATAQLSVPTPTVPALASPLAPLAPLTLRSFVAWQASDPRRIVQVSSASDGDSIRAYVSPTDVPFNTSSASFIYFDGKGGAWFGTSGTQHVSAVTSETLCLGASPNDPIILIYPGPPRCTNADFTVDFNARAEPSVFLAAKNPATGTHTFSMGAQPVAGVRLEFAGAQPPQPPVILPPRAPLTASLSVKVDTIATLTLTVTNPATVPAPVLFTSGQRTDFSIYEPGNGVRIWSSSMGVLFTQVVSTDTIPPKGERVYTAYWQPTKKGLFTAAASLTSRSHIADAKTVFGVQ